jgi:hypothetical protein
MLAVGLLALLALAAAAAARVGDDPPDEAYLVCTRLRELVETLDLIARVGTPRDIAQYRERLREAIELSSESSQAIRSDVGLLQQLEPACVRRHVARYGIADFGIGDHVCPGCDEAGGIGGVSGELGPAPKELQTWVDHIYDMRES